MPRAAVLGRYPSLAIDFSTFSRMLSLTPYALVSTLETADRETPASSATSLIVAFAGLASFVLVISPHSPSSPITNNRNALAIQDEMWNDPCKPIHKIGSGSRVPAQEGKKMSSTKSVDTGAVEWQAHMIAPSRDQGHWQQSQFCYDRFLGRTNRERFSVHFGTRALSRFHQRKESRAGSAHTGLGPATTSVFAISAMTSPTCSLKE